MATTQDRSANYPSQEQIKAFTKAIADQGKLVEAGWFGLRLSVLPRDAPPRQIEAMRDAFFAGAHHLFSCMVFMQDPGEDATEQDMKRMTLISAELSAFAKALSESVKPKRSGANETP